MYRYFLLAICSAAISCVAQAGQIEVHPGDDLQAKIDQALPNDILILHAGTYRGNYTIDKPLVLEGEEGTVIDSEGVGSSLTLSGENIKVSKLTLLDYGRDLYEMNSGVRILPNSHQITIDSVIFEGPGFGVRADNSSYIRITNCEVTGDKSAHVLDRGDGVFLKYTNNVDILNSKFLHVRDGFYFESSEFTNSEGNRFGGVQYGIHYMYTKNHTAENNYAAGVIGGYAIMDTSHVLLKNNVVERAVEFGILLNMADNNIIEGNIVRTVHNRKGRPELDNEGKALFVFGSGENFVFNNQFSTSDIGVGVAFGGEGTLLYSNAFTDNKQQVRYVGSGAVEWSKDKRGNYWSNYQGWDLNQDGIGDFAFQPNDSLDRLFWFYPQTRFLMGSPMIALMRFLSSQFEIDKGKGVTDSYPLMTSPVKEEKPS